MIYYYGLNSRSFFSQYTHQYSPPFESGNALSSAFHHQEFESTRRKVISLSWGIFPAKNFGVEIGYFHQSSPLQGTSSEYQVFLRYISRPPPAYESIEVTVNREHPWPPPHGHIDLKILNVDLAVRFGNHKRWPLCLSAGLSSFFLKGELGPIAFSRFWLGGHSVLFSEEYKLLARLMPNCRFGWNGGVSLSSRVIAGLSLSLDFRYYLSREIPLQLEIVDYDQNYELQGIEPILKMEPHLALRQVIFRPSFFSIRIGAKFSFL